jgi:hypothetical protein
MDAGDGRAEQWLIDFTKALRSELPQGRYILTHARMSICIALSKGLTLL